MAIHLDLALPSGSSSLPEGFGRAVLERLLLGLAPDEACHAANCHQRPGGLLHRRFTLTRPKPGGLFSVALALRSPWADVIRHRALRSPEVPQPCQMNDAAAAIWGSRISYYTAGQGFYAGESGLAGAPGETMNAECRIAVGGGAHPPAGGRWRVAPAGGDHPTVGRRQDAADPQPHRLMDHRIESWLDWHRHLPNIPYRYVAGLACMLDSARMVLYRQHCLAGKLVVPAFGDDEVHGPHDLYDDHPEQDLH